MGIDTREKTGIDSQGSKDKTILGYQIEVWGDKNCGGAKIVTPPTAEETAVCYYRIGRPTGPAVIFELKRTPTQGHSAQHTPLHETEGDVPVATLRHTCKTLLQKTHDFTSVPHLQTIQAQLMAILANE